MAYVCDKKAYLTRYVQESGLCSQASKNTKQACCCYPMRMPRKWEIDNDEMSSGPLML
jgi:hypothetical protein